MGQSCYSDHQDTHILSFIASYSLWAGHFHFRRYAERLDKGYRIELPGLDFECRSTGFQSE